MKVSIDVNGTRHEHEVEARVSLADHLRHGLGLTGTHVGCEHGVCGACTVLVVGTSARACLMLAVQADGTSVTTVEGLACGPADANDGLSGLSDIQQAMWERHGLQCGFCTPGILVSLTELLATHAQPDEEQVREVLSGHLCRCTGYQNIVAAALACVRQRSLGAADVPA